MPLKVKVFMWTLAHNSLLTNNIFQRRNLVLIFNLNGALCVEKLGVLGPSIFALSIGYAFMQWLFWLSDSYYLLPNAIDWF